MMAPPMVPPLRQGDGRSMLRPYGLDRTYPGQRGGRGDVPNYGFHRHEGWVLFFVPMTQ